MDVKERLREAGFFRVIALDAAEAGAQEGRTLLLALWAYEAEETPDPGEAWIHPYYFASQKAYRAASALARESQAEGGSLRLADELRVKPIFARLPGFAQGRNTLSYLTQVGSRFHVQMLLTDDVLPPDLTVAAVPHPLMCASCRRCLEACPTGALDEAGFHREKCLRNWMLSGKTVPEALRGHMGSRLIGCDDCQRCCPYNAPPRESAEGVLPLMELLRDARGLSPRLGEAIGANLAIPNRVLLQSCLLAGCSGRVELSTVLTPLESHPSPVVREHAAWACERLRREK